MPLRRDLTAADCMSTHVVTVSPEMDVLNAMARLVAHSVSGAPVLDERSRLVGMLTERDCIRATLVSSYHGECACGPVAAYMSREVAFVDVDTSLLEIAELFASGKFRRYPVMDGQRTVGIVSRRDVLRALLRHA